jgi:hypothetical protein
LSAAAAGINKCSIEKHLHTSLDNLSVNKASSKLKRDRRRVSQPIWADTKAAAWKKREKKDGWGGREREREREHARKSRLDCCLKRLRESGKLKHLIIITHDKTLL